jgi:7,8-dihydropterin-6-yl-methyl-4-(beta-D-ribofuranosyl)aminobenzene 5'-phosphate synthase
MLRPVDRVEITVVVDNALDLLSTVPDSVTAELPNDLAAGATEMSGPSVCCAAWGFSLYVSATVGVERHTVLFDGGPEGWAFERNAKRLGVELGAVDAVALSHGHWDHAGGLPAAIATVRAANGGRRVPAHVNPGMFVRRGFRLGDDRILPLGEVPTLEELETAGASLVNDPAPRTIGSDTFFLSGEIPRATAYEQGLPRQVKLGSDGSWRPDPLVLDERFLAVHVKDAGIVVFSSCSHAGIVNVLTHAREIFVRAPLYAVFGGLHLSGAANEGWIDDTVRDLAQFDLRRIVPGHCTGWRALHRLVDAFGAAVVPCAVGQTHRLGVSPAAR